jgi:hypothetical protein
MGKLWAQELPEQNDTLQSLLKKGVFEGQIRNFFMATVNHQNYPDYYALATGAGLSYTTPIIKHFQLGFSGFVIYNAASSSLAPQPPFNNRYEVGLFDVTNPDNQQIMVRLENLYARVYFTKKNKSFIQYGNFGLKSPLINLQDGRMRPSLQQGVWAEWNNVEKISVKGGWITRMAPRSTMHWYTIGESLVYPNGRAENGEKADYTKYTSSKGILVTGAEATLNSQLKYMLWNYYVDNLFNVTMQKMEWKKKMNHHTLMGGLQYFWQKSVYNDTLPIENQYIRKGEQSHVISARAAILSQHQTEWSLNYTRITSHGRFLFPREWGVEPFYTFMHRERNEGAGDVHALMLQHTRFMDRKNNLSLLVASGVYDMPSVEDARLNKFTMPSYWQLNVRTRYRFNGFFKGLNVEMLYTYKGNLENALEASPLTFHNKIDMHHFSIVMDYNF